MKFFKNGENESFSLAEFVIVIAVMALAAALMAPWLIKYVERSDITYDRQRADDVRLAVRQAMEDPEVLKDAASIAEIDAIVSENNTPKEALPISALAESDTVFAGKVAENLNIKTADLAHIEDGLKSKPDGTGPMEIRIWIKEGSDSYVRTVITNSNDGFGNAIASG